jgi:phage gpG-like protein
MKLRIEVNYSFGKLGRAMPKIIKEYLNEYALGTEKGSKANIDRGLADITNATKAWRKSQGYPESPPLKASGKMYNSIKANQNKLDIIQYGKWHNDGAVPTTQARPFISTDDRTRNKINADFRKKTKEALSVKRKFVLQT